MVKVKIKGHDIDIMPVTSSFDRRALQFSNKLIDTLGKLGVKRDDIECELEGSGVRKAPAFVTWYAEGHRMHYGHSLQTKFVDNLQVVMKVIEREVDLVLAEEKTLQEFIDEFREEEDVHEKRKEAREFLGLEHDVKDMEVINKRYKEMARDLHPDMPSGSTEKFKKLNHAHKTLKRELA